MSATSEVDTIPQTALLAVSFYTQLSSFSRRTKSLLIKKTTSITFCFQPFPFNRATALGFTLGRPTYLLRLLKYIFACLIPFIYMKKNSIQSFERFQNIVKVVSELLISPSNAYSLVQSIYNINFGIYLKLPLVMLMSANE